MRLKKKILFWLFVQLFLFLVLSWGIYSGFFKKVLLEIEKNWIASTSVEIVKYLEAEKKRVELLTRDWAVWDEAYEFLQDKNPKFPKSNLNIESYENNKLSVIIYLYPDGRVKAGGFFDKKTREILPLDHLWLEEHYHYYRSLYKEITLTSVYTALSFYKNVPSIVSFYPVSDSEGIKPPVGILVMVSPLDEEKLDLIKNIFGLSEVSFVYYKGRKVENSIKFDERGFYEVVTTIKDFFGNPLAMSFTAPRKLMFEKYLWEFILIQALFLALIFGIYYFHMMKVLKRIHSVKDEIEQIAQGKKETITLKGEDELVELVAHFNEVYSLLKLQIEEINQAKKIYQMIAERSNLVVAVFDEEKNLIYANSLWKNLMDDKSLSSFLSLMDSKDLEKDESFEFCLKVKNGKEVCFSFEIIPIKEYSLYYLVIGYDVSYFKERVEQLFDIATKDQLTGLYNRVYLKDVIKRIFELVKRGQNYCLLFMDVDYLKEINDQFGHLVGDEYLKAIAEVIKKNTRAEDIAVRWGGDEFLLILRADLEGVKKLAERVLQEVKKIRIKANGKEVVGSVSIGIIKIEPDRELEELLLKVDQALYKAKFEGRGVIKVLS